MICETCGVQFGEKLFLPICPICDDERQYVPEGGQKWATLAEVAEGRKIVVRELEDGLFELRCDPSFAIGQRMFFIKTPAGNFTWDFIPLVDKSVLEFIAGHGGVDGMAVSHPHFYSTMRHWAEALKAPIYLHENDKAWIGEQFSEQVFWTGIRLNLADEVQLICCGGHFEGSTVMHVNIGKAPFILSGDTIVPGSDRRSISVMRSFPNKIPLGPSRLNGITNAMDGIDFDKIYSGWPDANVVGDARLVFDQSMARYKVAIAG